MHGLWGCGRSLLDDPNGDIDDDDDGKNVTDYDYVITVVRRRIRMMAKTRLMMADLNR